MPEKKNTEIMACFPKDFRHGFPQGVESRWVCAFLFGPISFSSMTWRSIARGRIPIYLNRGACGLSTNLFIVFLLTIFSYWVHMFLLCSIRRKEIWTGPWPSSATVKRSRA